MNIQVRVLARQAQQQLAAVNSQVKQVNKTASSAGGGIGSMAGPLAMSGKQMVALGSQTQWTGRQLGRNFTFPILAAGAAATKFALDNETAFNRVVKVYGDGSEAMNRIAENELPALKRAFEALSNQYGVQQKEVLQIAGDWAAAGASGRQLAESVETTMKTMVLGEMEAGKATEALIAIQAQYGHNTQGLIETINTLNMVENQTGISLQGLVVGLEKSAGVARSAGIDVRHLAAMMAALVPASGSAANAGNALKTVISRMMSPTGEAAQVLKEMGIALDETSWSSKNAQQRLMFVAEEYRKLGEGVSKTSTAVDENGVIIGKNISAQQSVASTVLASRWQINRFDVLMRELTNSQGYYNRALRATASDTLNAAQAAKELDVVLTSNPRRLKQMGVILQNSLANVIQPLLPVIIGFAATIAKMARAFSETSPYVQKLVIILLILLATMGPVLIFMGSLITSIGVLKTAIMPLVAGVARLAMGMAALAAGPFVMVSRGLLAVGAASLASGGFLVKLVNSLRYLVVGMVASGGTMGAFAGTVGSIFAAMRVKAIWNFVLMRLAWHYTMVTMVAGAQTWLMRNLLPTFGATMLRIRGLMAAQMAAMLGPWIARWASMTAVVNLATLGMYTSLYTRLWAMAAFIRTGMLSVVMGQAMSALLGVVAAGMSALLVPVMTYGMRSVGIWTVIWTSLQARWVAFQVWMIAGHIGLGTRIAATHVALRTRLAAIWASTYAFILGRTAAFSAAWLSMHLVIHFKMLAIWAAGLAKLRLLWTATVALLLNPAVLLAKLRAFVMLFAALPAMLAGAAAAIGGVLLSPIGIALGAAVLLFYAFRDQIAEVFSNIADIPAQMGASWGATSRGLALPWYNLVGWVVGAFNKLPQGVQNAMQAVVNVVHRAAMAVYELFSYLNPFARHSPSLVDNVTNGMTAVNKQYARAGKASSSMVARARRDLAALNKITANMSGGEFKSERENIAKANPGALGNFNALASQLGGLRVAMDGAKARMEAQEDVVRRWDTALAAANKTVDAQKDRLDALKDRLGSLQDAYDAAETRMQNFAEAPIKGMGVYNDKLFANEMAQKKLRLEMMKWEDINGNIEDTKNQLAMLQGTIEGLQGDAADVRQAGGGSDVLGPVNSEIAKMQAEYSALEEGFNESPMKKMNKEMERLQREGERLDLEKAIKYDPLTRQIEQLANAQKELSFNEIIAGINKEKAAMAALEPQIKAATTAVDQQELAVKRHEAARDAIQATYDAENAKLDILKEQYRDLEEVVRDVEGALRDMGSAASAASTAKGAEEYVSPGLQNFRDAAGGSFPDPGGQELIGQRNPLVDETAAIDDFTLKSAQKLEDSIGKLDMLGPFKGAWGKVEAWWGAYIVPFFEPIKQVWDGVIGSVNWGAPFDKMFENDKVRTAGEKLAVVWDYIKRAFKAGVEGVKAIIALFAPDVRRIFEQVVQFVRDAINKIGPELAKFGPLIMPLLKVLGGIALTIGGAFLGLAKIIMSVIGHTIGPVFEALVDIIANAFQIIRGIIQVFIGLFTGDFKMIGDGVLNILGGAFGLIGDIFEGAFKIAIGLVKGFVGGVVGFFKWLYDVLVGHSIVPDMVKLIIKTFHLIAAVVSWLKTNVIDPIVKGFTWLKDRVVEAAGWLKDRYMSNIRLLLPIISWILTNIVNPGVKLFGDFRDKAESAAKALKDKVDTAIKALRPIIQWLKQNIVDPAVQGLGSIWNAAKPAMNTLLRGIAQVFNALGRGIAFGINIGLNAIDKLIDGLNWIGKNVPGLSFKINATTKYSAREWQPPQFAKGGIPETKVGGGFKTDGARAIVGEGRKGYPEYVIPTDPRYRRRATVLASQAMKDVGGVPAYAAGGVLDKIRAGAKGAASAVGNKATEALHAATGVVQDIGSVLRKGAVMAAMAAPLKAFDTLMKGMDTKPRPAKELIMAKKNEAYNWMKGVDEAAGKVGDERAAAAAAAGGGGFGNMGSTTGLNPTFLMMWNRFNASQGNRFRIGSGWRSSAQQARLYQRWINRVPGQAPAAPPGRSNHEKGLAIDHTPHSTAASRAAAAAFGLRYPMSYEPWHIEPRNLAALKAAQANLPFAAKGGILNGPAIAVAGEAGREVLAPLAPLWARFDRLESRFEGVSTRGGDGVSINIYGNLEFPNISSADDAEVFIENLEIMARGKGR